MSYILEALRRAERERKQGQVSVLDEVVVVKSAEPARRRPLQGWLPAVAVTVVIALMLYALLARRNHAGKDAVPATPVAAAPGTPAAPPGLRPMPPPPAPPVVTARRAAPPPPAATIEDGGKIASLDDVARPPPPQPDQQPDQPSAQELPPPTPQPMRSPHFGPPPRAGVPPPQTAAASPPATANDAAADGIETTAADSGDTPPPAAAAAPAAAQHALREMPESFRANFPAFTVDVHAYNDNPQRRFVIVNGKRYHDGDTLAEGPRVVAIVPEGMVLDWQGQQVLYAIAR